MSSRRRAVIKFPIKCSLFVNQKALYSITDMTKYYIKSVSGGEGSFAATQGSSKSGNYRPWNRQDVTDSVLDAVQGGALALFDLLAPIVGLELDATMSGNQVFPEYEESPCEHTLLQTSVHVPGETIAKAACHRITLLGMRSSSGYSHSNLSHMLLMSLPGFQDGRLGYLVKQGLLYESSLNRETSQ